ncbi:TPA: bifunctional methylenetetrahydrofolate dehydrogenase/methenyltetrahydrofolate cyclohydrolase [Methanosarcina acetivorans]|uniref:Bifunctional protein FolD n=2 Tax=Methanosarcina acetivorans TaxID=2214 RepID=FOLD_METAC|nr:bifunctional methylenetetrahydrofolate dehydrogenase/methenyltetrahydrofolate cyclohydrolase [Methanosarcina acetivorans]Q8TK95.1 RecName: Full=Bifunctional protein FolD; Includes: RecName: Full=Methylenetetrahydrofolate dehydrogenase; Includes: RecName: Full=Methenyltetrahydrofolate cyclohydrolase [Methanosarcina acetivorans C2A]AAM06882.1 methylenetetrahydrofolate dehydrogenase (NADP+)/methenyltetrahydrofolate cyclohydrolase [Methanosarcina acetivorans C2A]HIH94409.1 bifunctional methylenet
MSDESYESRIIDGKVLAQQVEEEVRSGVEDLESNRGIVPGLATILVGDDPASKMYVRLKHRACERVGIKAEDYLLPGDATQEELLTLIDSLNKNKDVHAILLQLPLPKHFSPQETQEAMEAISPTKDADGFHPYNMGKLMIGDEDLVPCTPHGVIRALEEYGVSVQGKNAVIVGHSNVVGKPMAAMLLNRNATVSVCHIFTDDLKKYTLGADIIVVATGVKHLIKADMVKEGTVIFDAGITKEEDGVYGDVDFENVIKKASLVTPVPGGVGPMTIAMLMKHVLLCAEKSL